MRCIQIPQRLNGKGKGPLFMLLILPLSPVAFQVHFCHRAFALAIPESGSTLLSDFYVAASFLAQISPLQRHSPCFFLLHTTQTNVNPSSHRLSHYPTCCLNSSCRSLSEVILVIYLFTYSYAVSPRHLEAAENSAWHMAGA